ncbi:UDP-N-acetylglucosamine 2-epimerase [Leptolyngbya sp. 'hensonii']|uniref:non-hydrolyzing UDP-N-acetylglucosamine 2-epimerase n=1 Tax=Leptolyngbya sp. 'hensonii' TaxID=1922337 RepID=UPI00094F5A92|nr:UDP-N-acetylglucosamine 2-epimerase (non-hydrolyzing) [Leptolyngbya sp. 'hensonii']OLP16485.1 UDP-N-acetylglucosamine 2-epimerase [Leptolyngbya sp. 'hensonii']
MKIATVLGARPQFIKASVVSQAFAQAGLEEVIIHTGQHFDAKMSDIFFQDLDLPQPHHHLEIHSLNHGAMTGRMMERLEELLIADRPDWICVYGDTNSTLAGALVGAKLQIPIAHVEAGLRSYNRGMPEEINRVVTDHLSALLFAPTPLAVDCLQQEGISAGVHLVGDVMMDTVCRYREKAKTGSFILEHLNLETQPFYLVTIHRPANTDRRDRLEAILQSLTQLDHPVVFPLHPRTRGRIEAMDLTDYLAHPALRMTSPASYLDMLKLQATCQAVITDSGGVQKEAYMLRRPCFTLRQETEWRETIDSGWNQLVEPEDLPQKIRNFIPPVQWDSLYGEGNASGKIAEILLGG